MCDGGDRDKLFVEVVRGAKREGEKGSADCSLLFDVALLLVGASLRRLSAGARRVEVTSHSDPVGSNTERVTCDECRHLILRANARMRVRY